jgi:rhodanese-related sulfurtransferase
VNQDRLQDVDPQTLKDWLDRGEAILVDVREEDEHARERIRGARLLPLSRLDRSAVPQEPGKALVLQCNSGNRSAKAAARIALPEGTPLYHLADGIQAWKRAGLPVEGCLPERSAAAA